MAWGDHIEHYKDFIEAYLEVAIVDLLAPLVKGWTGWTGRGGDVRGEGSPSISGTGFKISFPRNFSASEGAKVRADFDVLKASCFGLLRCDKRRSTICFKFWLWSNQSENTFLGTKARRLAWRFKCSGACGLGNGLISNFIFFSSSFSVSFSSGVDLLRWWSFRTRESSTQKAIRVNFSLIQNLRKKRKFMSIKISKRRIGKPNYQPPHGIYNRRSWLRKCAFRRRRFQCHIGLIRFNQRFNWKRQIKNWQCWTIPFPSLVFWLNMLGMRFRQRVIFSPRCH